MRVVLLTILMSLAVTSWGESIAVVGLDPEGENLTDGDMKTAKRLTLKMRDAVKEGAVSGELSERGGRDLFELKLLYDCSFVEPNCLKKVGKNLGAEKLVYGTVKMEMSTVFLSLFLFDVAEGRYVKSFTERVPRADLDASYGKKLMRRLFGVPNTGIVEIAVEDVPRGAQVLVDGTAVPQVSQNRVELPVGTSIVEIRSKDGRRFQKQVVVKEGSVAMLSGEFPSSKKAKRDTNKVLFWTAVAATGASGIAATIYGTRVQGFERDKEKALTSLAGDGVFINNNDVCAGAKGLSGRSEYAQINTACSKGQRSAKATNVLLGVTAATTAAAGYFFYKAYVAKKKGTSDVAPPAVTVVPSIGKDSLGAGLTIEF